MMFVLVACLVATAVGLKTNSYKPWEISLGVATGLALSQTKLGAMAIAGMSAFGGNVPGWLS